VDEGDSQKLELLVSSRMLAEALGAQTWASQAWLDLLVQGAAACEEVAKQELSAFDALRLYGRLDANVYDLLRRARALRQVSEIAAPPQGASRDSGCLKSGAEPAGTAKAAAEPMEAAHAAAHVSSSGVGDVSAAIAAEFSKSLREMVRGVKEPRATGTAASVAIARVADAAAGAAMEFRSVGGELTNSAQAVLGLPGAPSTPSLAARTLLPAQCACGAFLAGDAGSCRNCGTTRKLSTIEGWSTLSSKPALLRRVEQQLGDLDAADEAHCAAQRARLSRLAKRLLELEKRRSAHTFERSSKFQALERAVDELIEGVKPLYEAL